MAKDINISAFLIFLTICTYGLDYIIIYTGADGFTIFLTIPTLLRIIEIEYLMTEVVENPTFKFQKRAIANFPFVIYSISIRSKSIGTFQF